MQFKHPFFIFFIFSFFLGGFHVFLQKVFIASNFSFAGFSATWLFPDPRFLQTFLELIFCVGHLCVIMYESCTYVNTDIKQNAVNQARRLSRFRDGRSSSPPGSPPPPSTHTVHSAYTYSPLRSLKAIRWSGVWRKSQWSRLAHLVDCRSDLPWGSVRIRRERRVDLVATNESRQHLYRRLERCLMICLLDILLNPVL